MSKESIDDLARMFAGTIFVLYVILTFIVIGILTAGIAIPPTLLIVLLTGLFIETLIASAGMHMDDPIMSPLFFVVYSTITGLLNLGNRVYDKLNVNYKMEQDIVKGKSDLQYVDIPVKGSLNPDKPQSNEDLNSNTKAYSLSLFKKPTSAKNEDQDKAIQALQDQQSLSPNKSSP